MMATVKTIIYIANARIPTEKAHGYQISQMCESFAKQGVAVELWVSRRSDTNPENLFSFYGIERKFIVRCVGWFDFLRKGWPLQTFLYRIQTAFFLLHLVLKPFPKGAIAYTRNPEVVFALSCKGVKVVYEDHAWPKRKTGIYLWLLKGSFAIVAITKGIKSLYVQQTSKRVFVAPDAVRLDSFEVPVSRDEMLESFLIPRDKKICMYAGSFYLYAWKGVDILIEAARYLPNDVVVVLVGASESELEKLRAQNQDKKIIFLGRQLRNVIPKLLKSADVLVLPNKKGDVMSERYTSPLKLFEYMATKVPIVASRLPSIEEVLSEKNAYLIEPNNARALADGIVDALRNPKDSHIKAETAYRDVQYHTWDKRAGRIIDFIASVEE